MREKTKLGFTSAPRATVSMMRELKNGNSVSLVGDGPYGPSGKLKPGAAMMARHTRKAIIPISVKASSSFRLPWRWDRYEIALPFSKIEIIFHPPVEPPQGDLAETHQRVQSLLGNP